MHVAKLTGGFRMYWQTGSYGRAGGAARNQICPAYLQRIAAGSRRRVHDRLHDMSDVLLLHT